MRRPRFKRDAYLALRRRLIRETEVALAIGLAFPERTVRIPIVEAGNGVFRREFASRFWQDALDIDKGELAVYANRMSRLDDWRLPHTPRWDLDLPDT